MRLDFCWYDAPHSWHEYCFWTECTFMCVARLPFWANRTLQMVHWNGRSPLCTRMCRVRLHLSGNDFEHTSQTRCPCRTICMPRCWSSTTTSQTGHLQRFAWSNSAWRWGRMVNAPVGLGGGTVIEKGAAGTRSDCNCTGTNFEAFTTRNARGQIEIVLSGPGMVDGLRLTTRNALWKVGMTTCDGCGALVDIVKLLGRSRLLRIYKNDGQTTGTALARFHLAMSTGGDAS